MREPRKCLGGSESSMAWLQVGWGSRKKRRGAHEPGRGKPTPNIMSQEAWVLAAFMQVFVTLGKSPPLSRTWSLFLSGDQLVSQDSHSSDILFYLKPNFLTTNRAVQRRGDVPHIFVPEHRVTVFSYTCTVWYKLSSLP